MNSNETFNIIMNHKSGLIRDSAGQMDIWTGLPILLPTLPIIKVALIIVLLLFTSIALFAIASYVSLQLNLRRARKVGLPIRIVPFPPGIFSFFAQQIVQKLGLLRPGGILHTWLNMGRPSGHDEHQELGDVFLSVNPSGITMIAADPQVIDHVNSRRKNFSKPPNTGAIINLYGRNVINADGEVWRLHRKLTGRVFGEELNERVWNEAGKHATEMMRSWRKDEKGLSMPRPEDDLLRLGLHVITGSTYGVSLGWSQNPPTTSQSSLTYRQSMDQVTEHLMPLFMIPHWLLRLAPKDTTWGHAWDAYSAFGGYMEGMLEHAKPGDDNLLTAMLEAHRTKAEWATRKLKWEEVMGNSFIMLFAGHETTANTTHYSLILLALNQELQKKVLEEVDQIYEEMHFDGRTELNYEQDFPKAKTVLSVMYETLRVYTPTGLTNKWSVEDSPISFNGRSYLIPKDTRISINGTGVHFNPKVWGMDAKSWKPERWLQDGELLRPAKGTWLPFSEGARACTGRKFSTVEFVAVLYTLLRDYRVELDGWDSARVERVLKGRKAGAVTLQPPEIIPLRFIARR